MKNLSLKGLVWPGLLAALMLMGVAAWVYQYSAGLQVTGLSNPVSWGLYIITFAFLVGLSAGGLIVSSLAYIMKNDSLERIAPLGVIVAVASIMGAMAIIIPDVGHPERIVNILLGGNPSSPLFWDIVILIAYLAIGMVEWWILFGKRWRTAEPTRKNRVLRRLAYFVLPLAILVHSVTAWIFGLQVGRPFWFTGLMAPIFISSALVSGLGLLLLVMLAVRRSAKIKDEQFTSLGTLLASFIALDAFLLFSELMTISYARGVDAFNVVSELLTGRYAPFFWGEVLVGLVIPFLILVLPYTRRSIQWIGLASGLAMVGVFLKRMNIILPSFQNLNLDYAPGVSLGRYTQFASPFTNQPTYMPTWVEIMITVGVLAGVLFVITLGINQARTHLKPFAGEARSA
ncbi:MAG: NrfD/PsrC family molybdoenzyme membrane anchor subunit [Anaerolineales bacterium]